MTDSVELVIRHAIKQSFPEAVNITVLDLEERGDHPISDHIARVRWSSADLTHIEQLKVSQIDADAAAVQQGLLVALAGVGVTVEPPMLVEPSDLGAYVVSRYVPGASMGQLFSELSMRWELSAHGFTFARALARIHNVDWAATVPWMGDPESLPEDLIDEQLDDWTEDWQDRASRCPESYRGLVEEAMNWIDLHRPTEVSVSLCHGDFRPANVIIENDEVAAIVGWEHALVTDASYDLALLPFEIAQIGLPREDADLLSQAVFGSYLQSSKRSLGNLQFYAVARLLTAGLQSLGLDGGSLDRLAAFSDDTVLLFDSMRQAMKGDRKALWRT